MAGTRDFPAPESTTGDGDEVPTHSKKKIRRN